MNVKESELPDVDFPDEPFIDLGGIPVTLIYKLVKKAVVAQKRLKSSWTTKMTVVERAFNLVRDELLEVGLLEDGVYLDRIELYVAYLPSLKTAGYVYEKCGLGPWLLGFEEGVIYLPYNLPRQAYVPGGTLTDVIRHEFAHTWHWLEPKFFEREWFRKAFTLEYDDMSVSPYELWQTKMTRSRKYKKGLAKRRTEKTREDHVRQHLLKDFVSEYAATAACEDFAETFMMFLRYRNSLSRFRSRPGVYRKLRAVERAVKTARRELDL